MGTHEKGEGGRQPAPLQWAGGGPLTGCDVKPVKAPQAGLRGQLPTAWGAFLRGQSPREKPPLSKGGAERKRGGGIPGRLRV